MKTPENCATAQLTLGEMVGLSSLNSRSRSPLCVLRDPNPAQPEGWVVEPSLKGHYIYPFSSREQRDFLPSEQSGLSELPL